MSTIQVDRIIPFSSASVTIEGNVVQADAATTGSNTFVGDQNIQGTITASIAEGFALVGGVGNISTLVATSSFGGGAGFPFTGDAQITGSLLISGSSEFDLTIQGRQLITGPTTGQTPQLLISGSDFNNRVGRSSAIIKKAGRDIGTGLTYGRLDAFENINSSSFMNIGVFDEPNFVTDIELLIQVNTGSGIEFQDIRNDNYAYSPFMSIAPNTGNNPDVVFKRSVNITGSLTISGSAGNDLVVEGRMLISGPTSGQTPQFIISGSDSTNTVGRTSMVISVTTGSLIPVVNAASGSGINLGNQTNCLVTSNQITSLETSTSGSYKRISISSNPSKMGFTALSAITQPSLLGLNNSATIYQVFELQSQGNFTDGTVSFKVPVDISGSVAVTGSLSIAPTHQVRFATGSNQQADTAVLVAGEVIVGNTLVNANSIILLTKQTFTSNHFVAVSSKGAGTFTIESSNNSDTDTVGYFIINNS